jgi:hypothetical protein
VKTTKVSPPPKRGQTKKKGRKSRRHMAEVEIPLYAFLNSVLYGGKKRAIIISANSNNGVTRIIETACTAVKLMQSFGWSLIPLILAARIILYILLFSVSQD